MAKCLEQFATAEPAAHHRITRWFMDTSFPGNMRSDFDKMLKGEGMTPRLKAAVESLQWVPLDDCVCEGPHAAAKRVKTPATAATWGWVASTMRLEQNLRDCRSLPTQTHCSLKVVWSSWATDVQPVERAHRFPKLKRREFMRRLYRCDHLMGFKIPTPMLQLTDASGSLAAPLGDAAGGEVDVIDGAPALQDMAPHEAVCRVAGRGRGGGASCVCP